MLLLCILSILINVLFFLQKENLMLTGNCSKIVHQDPQHETRSSTGLTPLLYTT